MPGIPTPPSQTRRSPTVKITAILAAMLVVGAAIVGAEMALGNSKGASLPDAVGPYRQLNTATVQQSLDAFHSQAERSGLEADLAVYGGSSPRLLLAWIRDATVTDPETALTAFASGFAQGFGGNIATDQKQTQAVDGTTFVCAPITGNIQQAVCLWQQREVFYILFDPESGGNLNATLGLSVTAHRAIG
jgi:hypothetical protein